MSNLKLAVTPEAAGDIARRTVRMPRFAEVLLSMMTFGLTAHADAIRFTWRQGPLGIAIKYPGQNGRQIPYQG